MPFDHKTLITHDLTVADGCLVLVNHKQLKASLAEGKEVLTRTILQLDDVQPDAVNLICAAIHMYQMIVRNQIGITHIQNLLQQARTMRTCGPILATELIGLLEQLQQLNRATRTLVVDGQEAADRLINPESKNVEGKTIQ